MPKIIAKVLNLEYIKGSSDVISGIKKHQAKKIEYKGAIGGNGTYRINDSSELKLLIEIDKKITSVNIKKTIKDELGFKKFTEKRIKILKENLPKELVFIIADSIEQTINIDKDSDTYKEWINKIKSKL